MNTPDNNKPSASQELALTHEARQVIIDGQATIQVKSRIAWWFIDTRIAVAHWCEDYKELFSN